MKSIYGIYGRLVVPDTLAYDGDNNRVYFEGFYPADITHKECRLSVDTGIGDTLVASVRPQEGVAPLAAVDLGEYLKAVEAYEFPLNITATAEINPSGDTDTFSFSLTFLRGRTLADRYHNSESVVYLPPTDSEVNFYLPSPATLTSSVESRSFEGGEVAHIAVGECDDEVQISLGGGGEEDCLKTCPWHYYTECFYCYLYTPKDGERKVFARPDENLKDTWYVYGDHAMTNYLGVMVDDMDDEGIFGIDWSQVSQIGVTFYDASGTAIEGAKLKGTEEGDHYVDFDFEIDRFFYRFPDFNYGEGVGTVRSISFSNSEIGADVLRIISVYNHATQDEVYVDYDVVCTPVTSVIGLIYNLLHEEHFVSFSDLAWASERMFNPYDHSLGDCIYYLHLSLYRTQEDFDSYTNGVYLRLVATRKPWRWLVTERESERVYSQALYFDFFDQTDNLMDFSPRDLRRGPVYFDGDLWYGFRIADDGGMNWDEWRLFPGDCHRWLTVEGHEGEWYFDKIEQVNENYWRFTQVGMLPAPDGEEYAETTLTCDCLIGLRTSLRTALQWGEGEEFGDVTAHYSEGDRCCGTGEPLRRGTPWCYTEDKEWAVRVLRGCVSDDCHKSVWLRYLNTDGVARYVQGEVKSERTEVERIEIPTTHVDGFHGDFSEVSRRVVGATTKVSRLLTVALLDVPEEMHVEDIVMADEVYLGEVRCEVTDSEMERKDGVVDFIVEIKLQG